MPCRRARNRLLAARASCVLSCALATALLGSCSKSPTPPNILWISIDTLRADHLGCYGYERDTSPVIDAIARKGTVFENAWSTTSWTLPAHVSMFTGLPVSAHGQCDYDIGATTSVESHQPRGSFVTEALAGAGYDCAGFYSCIYLEPKFGFGPGFETWERAYHSFKSEPGVAERWQAAKDAGDNEEKRRIFRESPELFDQDVRTTPVAVDAALSWLEKRAKDEDPFLLFLHTYDAHTNYTPPEPFATKFDPDYQGKIDGRMLGGADSPVRADMDPRDLQHIVALYDGEIAAIDADLGRLIAELERSGVLANTLVIVTSDHGEEFFEHGNKMHGGALYRETLQVPLIVSWPGHIPAGARRKDTASLIDLAPSLLAAAGLEPDSSLPGVDLIALANDRGAEKTRTFTAQLVLRRAVDQPIWMEALIDEHEHTIVRLPGTADWTAESFDLDADPRERAAPQRIDATSPQAAALLEKLEIERKRLRHWRELAAPRSFAGSALDQEELIHIHQLGYSGDGNAAAQASGKLCMDGCIWRR